MNIRILGIVSALVTGVFVLLTNLDIGTGARLAAALYSALGALYTVVIFWKVLSLNALRAQFEESDDPELNDDTFQEVVDDLNAWSKQQFNRLTTSVLLAVIGVRFLV